MYIRREQKKIRTIEGRKRMSKAKHDAKGPGISFSRNYRKLIWLAIGVAVYALLGFLLVPWIVQTQAVAVVRDSYSAELRLSKVEFNPFVLGLRVTGIELDDPSGQPVARIDEVYANFQLSSIFRRAWTFDELRFTAPELSLARDSYGEFNIAYLLAKSAEGQVLESEQESSVARVLVFNFAIDDCAINWRDEVPAETVATRFGPINIDIQDLNTLPDRSGQQSVSITTESTGTLSWTGSLQLNPLHSVAHASVKGSHFPLTSAYFQHQTGFQIIEGNADAELDYSIDTLADGSISADVNNINLRFEGVVVSTFSGASVDDVVREVLAIPTVQLADGNMRWPEKEVSFASVEIDDAQLNLHRDSAGVFNVNRRAAGFGAETEVSPPLNDSDSEWRITLGSFLINRMGLVLEDQSVEPAANVGFSNMNLSVDEISNAPGAEFPVSLSLDFLRGGGLRSDGSVSVLPSLNLDTTIVAEAVVLAGAHPYIKPLADVSMDSGTLNIEGSMQISADEQFSFAGDLAVLDFEITETDEGSILGSWESMAANDIALSVVNETLVISEILFSKPYGDIVIAADGSLNLGRIERQAPGTENIEAVGSGEAEIARAEPGFDVTIGRVILSNAAADFADFSLPLPFSVGIEELNGDLTTVATGSSEPSAVTLEGKVDEHGFVRVTGSVTPLDPSLNTDLVVAFQNIQMPKFTAYTVPFAGREIASGSLDLRLGYQVTNSVLVGENNIVLRELELGEKVEHPGAASLPLGLAVALLKDSEGKIDIDLPVRGDLNDPEFSYGGIVGKALVNLIVKIVASPFTLLGKLIGVEADELEYIHFLDGRADLTPPERQRAAKIAEALVLRPELILEIAGVVDKDTDGQALRTAKLDDLVEAEIENSSGEMYAEQQRKSLERMFGEQIADEDPSRTLQAIREQFTVAEEFDALAYTKDIRRQLIDVQPLGEPEFVMLAKGRAENTKEAIVEVDASLQDRIFVRQSKAVARDSGEMIRMKVSISTED